MEECKISVVVLQYNQKLDAMLRTLESIIMQRGIEFDVVISDDASERDYFTEIQEYFEKRHFTNYCLVKNKTNGGTVANSILGVEHAKGKYVHVISPGDLLYSRDTLLRIADAMQDEEAYFSFGRAVYYSYADHELKTYHKSNPYSYRPYYKNKNRWNQLKRHLMIYQDRILGAVYSWNREYYLKCLNKMLGNIIYSEDLSGIYPVMDRKKILFMDEYVLCYEFGSGISTRGDFTWIEKIHQDDLSFFALLQKEFSSDLTVRRANKLIQAGYDKGKWNKLRARLWGVDRILYSKIGLKIQKEKENPEPDLSELKNILRIVDDEMNQKSVSQHIN